MSTEDTGVTPETGADNKALDSNTNQPSNPSQDNAAVQDEVAKLRKEREQIEMERNMLRKKLEAEEKAKAEAEAKKLEEQNEFKTLYEQEKQRAEQYEREREERERNEKIAQAKNGVLAEYPSDVQELANDLGIDLTSDDESDIKVFKEKLDKAQARIASGQKVTPNNPSGTKPPAVPEGDDLKLALKNSQSFDDIVAAKFPGIQSMMTPKQ